MAGLPSNVQDPVEVGETHCISIDLADRKSSRQARIPKGAKNVDVQIHLGGLSIYYDEYFAEELASELKTSSGTDCWVRLKYTQFDVDAWKWRPERLPRFFETLKGFENVYLYLYLDVGNTYHPRDRRLVSNGDILTQILRDEGSNVQKTLGPMTFHDSNDPKARYINFHPRQFNEVSRMRELDLIELDMFCEAADC